MIVYGFDTVSWIRCQSCLCTFAFPHLFQPLLNKLQIGLDICCPRDTPLFFCSCMFSLAALLHLVSLIVSCCAHQLCSWYSACSCTISYRVSIEYWSKDVSVLFLTLPTLIYRQHNSETMWRILVCAAVISTTLMTHSINCTKLTSHRQKGTPRGLVCPAGGHPWRSSNVTM